MNPKKEAQINNTIAEYINNDRSIFVESKMNY